jgi:hypothetical protein
MLSFLPREMRGSLLIKVGLERWLLCVISLTILLEILDKEKGTD